MEDPRAFTLADATLLTEIPEGTLRDWARDGFFPPVLGGSSAGYFGFYSFRDLVGLRTVRTLRRQGISQQHLNDFSRWLHAHYQTPWSSLKFHIIDGKQKGLAFTDPATGRLIGSRPMGQVHLFNLPAVVEEMEGRVKRHRQRPPESIGKLASIRGVQGGKLCIAGTRFPVETLVSYVDDDAVDEIQDAYPFLEARDIAAAVEHIRKHPEQFKRTRRRNAS